MFSNRISNWHSEDGTSCGENGQAILSNSPTVGGQFDHRVSAAAWFKCRSQLLAFGREYPLVNYNRNARRRLYFYDEYLCTAVRRDGLPAAGWGSSATSLEDL